MSCAGGHGGARCGEGTPLDLAALDGTWRLCYTLASDVLVLFEAAERLPPLQVKQHVFSDLS